MILLNHSPCTKDYTITTLFPYCLIFSKCFLIFSQQSCEIKCKSQFALSFLAFATALSHLPNPVHPVCPGPLPTCLFMHLFNKKILNTCQSLLGTKGYSSELDKMPTLNLYSSCGSLLLDVPCMKTFPSLS